MLRNLVLYLVPMILSLTVHEFAHALVATKLGDDTPERDGRVTLSPLEHIDVIGTLVFPISAILLTGSALFGWARPVMHNPSRFKRNIDMRRGSALVAVAGPLSNLLLSVLSIATMALLNAAGVLRSASPTIGAFFALLSAMFTVNIGLFVFNLLPLPPFDGHYLLPRSLDPVVEAIRPYSFMLLMVVLMIPGVRAVLLDLPVTIINSQLRSLFGMQ